jgi:hypothetical protein
MPRRSKNRQPLHAVWNGGKKGVPLMHVHMDRKWLEVLDGNLIAFIVISLLIVIAFAS